MRLALAVALALGCHAHAPARPTAAVPRAADEPPTAPAATPPGAPLYLVVYGPGASFRAGKPLSEQPLRGHFGYLSSLYRQGILKWAGGFGDEQGGALVFTAPDDAAALAVVRADPAVKDAVFGFQLRRWHLVDWAQHARGTR